MTSRLNDDTLRITLRGPSESLRDSKIDENALAPERMQKAAARRQPGGRLLCGYGRSERLEARGRGIIPIHERLIERSGLCRSVASCQCKERCGGPRACNGLDLPG